MRKLGIDFGTKKVGLALTDEAGQMAFPHAVVPNDDKLLSVVELLIADKHVSEVVIGHSKDLDGNDNSVQTDIEAFIGELTLRTPTPIHLEPEQFTSVAAASVTGRNDMIDAAAAALILEGFLAKQNTMSEPEPTEEETAIEAEVVSNEISYEQFAAVEIKLGTILEVAVVEDADKLLQLTVDVGEDQPRQIVSGIREFFDTTEELVGRQCPFITNLAPRKIRGLQSNGMILAAGDADIFALMHPSLELPPGTLLH